MKQSYTNFDDLLSDVADGVEQIMQDVAPQIETVLQQVQRKIFSHNPPVLLESKMQVIL